MLAAIVIHSLKAEWVKVCVCVCVEGVWGGGGSIQNQMVVPSCSSVTHDDDSIQANSHLRGVV